MNTIRSMIFPSGKYHPKYYKYVKYSFMSNVIISMESAMATHSMLHSLSSESDSLRTMNYIGKDIIGQIGGLVYITATGTKVDKEPRKILYYSHVVQQVGFLTLSMTPMIPTFFLPVAGMSNILSNISFTGFGAINAKCIQILAMDNNIGEIYAKISLINTVGSSLGLLFGLLLVAAVPDHTTRLCLIPILAYARIYTFRKATDDIL